VEEFHAAKTNKERKKVADQLLDSDAARRLALGVSKTRRVVPAEEFAENDELKHAEALLAEVRELTAYSTQLRGWIEDKRKSMLSGLTEDAQAAHSKTVTCPECKREVARNLRFCDTCGAALGRRASVAGSGVAAVRAIEGGA